MRAGPKATTFGVLAGMGLALVFVVIAALALRDPAPDAQGARPDADTIVATLGAGDAEISEALRAALGAARDAPQDRAAAVQAARLAIAEGRAAGASRLVGSALGVLRPHLGADDAEVLTLAATARQYQHDFSGALDLLDRAISADPRYPQALLSRATIRTVLGEFTRAEQDCRALHALPRLELGFLCQSAARVLSAEAPAVHARLDAILGRPGLLDPSLEGYARALMGEIAILQGWTDRARADFEAALAVAPDDLRTRALYADLLIAAGEAEAALALTDGVPEIDALLIRRAIAAEAAGDAPTADAARDALAARMRETADLGLDAHAREEARYYLDVAPDAALALERAQVNWDLQHEFEDAQLLLDAAVAAGAPEAAVPVLDWIAAEGVAVPMLEIPDPVREAAQ